MEAIGTGYDRPGHDHPAGCMCNICIKWRQDAQAARDRNEQTRKMGVALALRILAMTDQQAHEEWFSIQHQAHEIAKRDR